MAGYSGKSLTDKLGIKPGHRLLLRHAPDGLLDALAPLPSDVQVVSSRARTVDCALLFCGKVAVLEAELPGLVTRLVPDAMLWIAWPKRAAGIPTDLSESTVRRRGLATGLVDVKVCAITEVWSGLKFVRRLRDR